MNEAMTSPVQPSDSGIFVSGIYVYPIKSCGGIALDTAELDERGIRHDRRWMLIDENNTFVSQRTDPRLALVRIRIGEDALCLSAPGMPDLELPLAPEKATTTLVAVWDDVVEVSPAGGEADPWFSDFLGSYRRLVYLPDDSIRSVDPEYGRRGDRVGLSDGFPLLLISESSLEDLNEKLETPLPMDRFRPNIVVSGCGAFAEDDWRAVQIGDVGMRVVKPCARCKITTVDQNTAATSKEPLRTLARYRKRGSEVFFGQNLALDSVGLLHVGAAVEIIPGYASDT